MTGRPVAALTESVARQIVREHNGNRDRIAVALAEEVIARGGWKASTCQPLLRAFQLAAPSTLPAETREGREALADRLEVIVATIDGPYYAENPDLDALRPWCERVAAALLASPAVSLPGEERQPGGDESAGPGLDADGFCLECDQQWPNHSPGCTAPAARAAFRRALTLDPATLPPIPGEQPGGQER